MVTTVEFEHWTMLLLLQKTPIMAHKGRNAPLDVSQGELAVFGVAACMDVCFMGGLPVCAARSYCACGRWVPLMAA